MHQLELFEYGEHQRVHLLKFTEVLHQVVQTRTNKWLSNSPCPTVIAFKKILKEYKFWER